MKSLMRILLLATAACLFIGRASAQLETVGGPYTPDSATVLLLHFDGDLTNKAATQGKTAAAAVPHSTNIATKISYITQTGVLSPLGKAVRLDNSSINDSTYLTVADTASLDMTGSWTIEAWANIFTFGSGSSDYRWVPRVVMKPGDETFYVNVNYWLEMWGDNRLFHGGYHSMGDVYVSVTSPNNMFVPGEWVHLTFIRDTARAFIAVMVHDQNKVLKGFLTKGFNKNDPPHTNKQALHIGWAGAAGITNPSTDSWLDGFVDEVRVSNVVRNFAGPPVIQDAAVLANQSSALASYPVNITVFPLNAGGSMSGVTLYYRADTNAIAAFTSIAMAAAGNNKYTASIPGQAGGKIIQYYYKTTDNNNQTSYLPVDAPTSKTYYSFYVFTPNSKVLDLTFEEGPNGKLIDHSPNNTTIKTLKDFKYSTQVPMGGGTYSLDVKGKDGIQIDSNWVEAKSLALAAEEFTVDCWLKADSADRHAARILINPSAETDWNNANFELSFRNGAAGLPVFTARYWRIDGSGAVTLQDTLVAQTTHVGKWRHVILERNKTNGAFAMVIRNENDVLMYKQKATDMLAPLIAGAPLRIGRSWFDITNQYYVGPYRGLIDNVKVYNYPATGITAVGDEPVGIVHEFKLSQNFPNPFNPSTEIQFTLPAFQDVSLIVYDVLGRQVKTLVNEQRHAGKHFVTWDGSNNFGSRVSSGVYFYKMVSGQLTQVRKMMLLK
jgi:hypothetical protein